LGQKDAYKAARATSGPRGPAFKLWINIFDLNLARVTHIKALNGLRVKTVAHPCSKV